MGYTDYHSRGSCFVANPPGGGFAEWQRLCQAKGGT